MTSRASHYRNLAAWTAVGLALVIAPLSATATTADVPPPAVNVIDPTSPERPGYILTASEEFNGDGINSDLFMDSYLPHWSTSKGTKANYRVSDGTLKLYIDPNQAPWDPAHDSDTKVSSLQTFNKDYIHRWTNYRDIAHHTPTFRGFTQKYGYFEVRAKAAPGGGVHSAWWMTGVHQDLPEGANKQARQSGEVDIFEILGRNGGREAQMAVHPWGDKLNLGLFSATRSFADGTSFTDTWHTYGFEWLPNQLKLFVDGKHVVTHDKAIDYPMMMYLGVYEKTQRSAWTGPFDPGVPYPKVFEIDYVRAYQKQPVLPHTVRVNDGFLYGKSIAEKDTTRWIGGSSNGAILTQVWAPADGTYELSLGYRSQLGRDLTVTVNESERRDFHGLTSGSFTGPFKRVHFTAQLQSGWNRVRFGNDSGPAPDLGSLTVHGEVRSIDSQILASDTWLEGTARLEGSVVRWLGNDRGTLTATNVYAPTKGTYRVSVNYLSGEPRDFDVTVNGQLLTLPNLDSGSFSQLATASLEVPLKEGFNELKLGNRRGPAPDFHSLTVEPLTGS